MRFKFAAVSSLALLLAGCAATVPDIDVVETYDLGKVSKGNRAIAELPVRNLGDAALKVEAISTSCGCTTAKLSSMTVPPGGQAMLHVEYDSNAHESDKGAIERYVFISSDDPDEPDMQVKFSVFVEEKAVSQPSNNANSTVKK